MGDYTCGGSDNPSHSIQTVDELAAMTGQRVWLVRQLTRLKAGPDGTLVFDVSNRCLIVEWTVGPFLKIVNNRPRDDTFLSVAERNEWSSEARLYNVHWSDANLLRRQARTVMVSGYLPSHKPYLLADRFGASAMFAREADANSHAVFLALAHDYVEPEPGRDADELCDIMTHIMPEDLYRRTGRWSTRPTTP